MRATTPPPAENDQRRDDAAPTPLTIGHLAHELNSLLDGSLRCLALAQRSLDAVGSSPSPDVADRLQIASDGMRRMEQLLARTLQSPQADVQVFNERQRLGVQVQQIRNIVEPLASEHRVELEFDVSPSAAALPAATLGPVILNGLRNAIQSCAMTDHHDHRVELAITVTLNRELLLFIADNGNGPARQFNLDQHAIAHGHGYGLELCKQIVKGLGGELCLSSIPFSSGAIFHFSIPVASLQNWGERG